MGLPFAIILPVILIQISGYGEETSQKAGSDIVEKQGQSRGNVQTHHSKNEETIDAPFSGKIIPLLEVPDEVFSSGAMGKGGAIEIRQQIICSVCWNGCNDCPYKAFNWLTFRHRWVEFYLCIWV